MSKVKKISLICVATIAFLITTSAAFAAFLLFTEAGHNFLIAQGASYLKAHDIDLKIPNTKDLKNFEEININFQKQFEVAIKNLSINNKNFSIESVFIKDLRSETKNSQERATQNTPQNKISQKETTQNSALAKELSNSWEKFLKAKNQIEENAKILKILEHFVKEISIKNAELNSSKTYKISDINFIDKGSEIFLAAKIHSLANIKLNITKGILFFSDAKLDVNEKNINATLNLSKLNSANPEYDLNANISDKKLPKKIAARGFFNEKIIEISKCDIVHENMNFNLSGKIDFKEKNLRFTSDIPLKYFLPQNNKILDSYRNLLGLCEINSDFNLNGKGKIKFDRSKKIVGYIDANFDKKNLNISGDISFINLYGFKFKKISGQIKNYLKIICDTPGATPDVSLKLFGENFTISAAGNFDKKFQLKKCTLESDKGQISLEKPALIDFNSDFTIDFNYKDLSFFSPIFKISGNGSAKLIRKNGKFSIEGNFPKAIHKGVKLLDSVIKIHDKLKMRLSAKNVFLNDANFKDVTFELDQKNFNLAFKTDEKKNFIAKGNIEFDDESVKISNTIINFNKRDFFLDICEATRDKKKIKAKLQLSTFSKNKKNPDLVQVIFDDDILSIKIQKLKFENLANFFEKKLPLGILDANIKLKTEKEIFIGDGDVELENFLSARNSISAKIYLGTAGITINATIKNRDKKLLCHAAFPFILNKNKGITNAASSNFSGELKGDFFLKDFFSLADRIEIRGKIHSNLNFSGTVFHPEIKGEISLENGLFAINDLVLANGKVLLYSEREKLRVSYASFTDSSKHKLKITGYASIFFDNFVPKLETNFDLHFDKFRLFDSDDLVVVLSGQGKLSGVLPNPIIKGEVDVHTCEINDLAPTEKEHLKIHYKGKKIQNLDNETDERSVFDYDVLMHGHDIILSNEIYEIHMAGDFRLNTYNEIATISGFAKLKNGTLDFFGKRMNFIKGDALFFKEHPFKPSAHLICERNFGDLSVKINILNDPQKGGEVSLSSTPNYSTDVILSKILFGKDLQQLSVEEAAQLAHAVSSFNNKGYLFSILNTFKKIGIFDTISFSEASTEKKLYTDSSSSNGPRNTNIKAGKYLGDKIFISVNKNDEGASFDVDYSITPSISIKANTNGEAGISFKYRY